MKSNYVLPILLAGFILFSCKKDKSNQPPVTPPPGSDAQTVLLKDVVIQGLPTPYYHFEYDDSGYITQTGFSSGIRSYEIIHAARRISEIKSNHPINKDRLIYQYENGRVFLIKYIDENAVNYRRCFVSYNNIGQLSKMEWERRMSNATFAAERTVNFTYYADGNLQQLKNYRHAIDGQQVEGTDIDNFENYDNKVNPDGFSLIHNSNEHLLLLPGVKLQKNNPLKTTRAGTGVHYGITYTYTYNQLNRPLQKTGAVSITSGPDAGKHFQSNTAFTYYP
jgi:hypothetical protein